jgi:hypothetical protein
MLATTEHNSFLCHGLGPTYKEDCGRVGVYLYTKSGVGPHGRGITGSLGMARGQGWVRSVPLHTGIWHHVRVCKTRRSLSISINGEKNEEVIPPSMADDDFLMKTPGLTLVDSGKGNSALHGEINDFIIETNEEPIPVIYIQTETQTKRDGNTHS